MARRKTPIEALSEIFGSERELARVCGVVPSAIYTWKNRASSTHRRGHLPPQYNEAVTTAAKKWGLGDVSGHLDDHHCPTCGQPLPKGKKAHYAMRQYRRKTNGTQDHA